MKTIDLSIIVTAHNEGLLLYKTLKSVFCATAELEKNHLTYEVIVHVDKGDKETRACLKKFAELKEIKVLENDFGNLSKSRNYATSVANGEYVTFLDGDDLISCNWYLRAIKILKQNEKDSIIYPEAVLTFQDYDNNHVLSIQKEYTGSDEDYLTLLSANKWGSVVMAKKKVLMKTPYVVLNNGYCFEDYVFNIQTLERDVMHLVAPETVLFYRRQRQSMLARANDDSLVLPRMSLFELKKVKKEFEDKEFFEDRQKSKNDEVEENDTEEVDGAEDTEDVEETVETKTTFRDNIIYRKIRDNWLLNYIVTPFLRLALIIKNKTFKTCEDEQEIEEKSEDNEEIMEEAEEQEKRLIPEFVLEKWREINDIDIQLYPRKQDIENTELYDAEDSIDIGKAFAILSRSYKHLPDYVFVVPWLVMGGADKVILNYIETLLKIHPDWHIAVITTLCMENTWANRLPGKVDLYELGVMTQFLSEDGVDVLLTRLLTQLGCKRIHIINSKLGYQWAKKHGTLVKEQYELYVSIFAEERVMEWDGGSRIDTFYENPGLFEIFPNVKYVFADNKRILDIMADRNGFDEKKLKVHYQPIDISIIKRNVARKATKRILWAGRIDTVKMPELVIEIGKRLKDIKIDIYGMITNDCYDENMFDEVENVKYFGEYNGFDEIPSENYDLFLYTSKNDGLPNTILEATAKGLPIIASNDGGVGEFIVDKETGVLIEDYCKPDEYVRAIYGAYNGDYDLEKMVKNAQKLLKERHTKEAFIKNVKKDIG